MRTKTEKTFIYEGLGFPIILHNAPLREIRGVWTLDVDLNQLQKVILLSLAHHPSDLTGDQIFFIRNWLELTQKQFGELLGVTHPAVVKWEKQRERPTKINLATQRDLRLLLLDRLLSRDKDFRQAFRLVHSKTYLNRIQHLELDVSTDLVAI